MIRRKENKREKISRTKDDIAVDIRSVSKNYRIYHEKIPSLKNTIIRGRRTTFEEFMALDDVSLSINHGQTIGIIGPNGSGKSTLLKLMANIIQPTKGEIIVNGPMSALLELGAGFHPDLTGKENIYINAAILGMKKREIDKKLDDIIEFSGLEKFIDTPVKNYSSGMYMRLGFSVAIKVNPDILLVDEVLAVGDQVFQAKCYKIIYDFMKRGKTIIIVSHDLDTIADLCSRVVFLKDGKIKEMGKPLDIVSKYRAYVEEIEKKRIIEQQRNARKKIFKSVIKENKKILSGEEINRLSNLSIDGETINRFGSGEAEITDIRMLDENDRSVDYCKYGDKIRVIYDVLFKAEVEEPIFGMRVTDHRQNIVYGTNTRLQRVGSRTFKNGDRVSIEFAFTVTMMGGQYTISPAVGYNDTKTYCDWVNDMLMLNVMHNNVAEGICDLNPRISIGENK
ncbi:MAG TPA: sugar ABC transporter ATP-binding protein [Actinobacteria bacterium]|nr:sugar ABC transporter ATP-binding protein [Actinomycetota bacterium]